MRALCSKEELEKANLWPCAEPGGNVLSHNLDHTNHNWDKLSLNFTPHTPMIYRKKQESHICLFVLHTEIATYEGVIFTDTNAASKGQKREKGLSGLNLVNFGAIHSSPQPWDIDGWMRPVQAEILVPCNVDLSKVIKVVFVSKASLQEGTRLWADHSCPPFYVEPKYFADSSNYQTTTLNFPYLIDLKLTDEEINKDSVSEEHLHKSHFEKNKNGYITAIAKLHAITGMKAQIIWSPYGLVEEIEFEQNTDYWHWPGISMNKLPIGKCSLEYKLGGIRWATINFELVS